MRSALLTVVEVLVVWTLISVVAGLLISRINRQLQSRRSIVLHPNFRPANSLPAHINVGRMRPVDFSDEHDAVEATGEVYDPVPVSDWPDEALGRLWAATGDGEEFETEMLVYELQSELNLLGVAGFTMKWKWRDPERDTERGTPQGKEER